MTENALIAGKFITTAEGANTFVLSRKFTVNDITEAVLNATALGVYKVEINGVRVGDAYMTPGFTTYRKTLQVQRYDVTDLIRNGENVIAFTVSEGWCCTVFNFHRNDESWQERPLAESPSVAADLIIETANGRQIISTDTDWRASESYISRSSIYDGETQDFVSPKAEFTAEEFSFDKSVLVPQINEYVRNIERIPAKKLIITPNGERVYDFGQNLTGVCEIVTDADFDGTISVRHAEILDKSGNFYTKNLRTAKATDKFKVKGARILVPEFTFHGFRFAQIEGAELPTESVTAIVRHTDMARTGHITCSNPLFDRLMQNVVWGQRGNFLDIPTDCPQRDERLGWTGDANVFCQTAAFNYDVRKFFKKWLADVRNEQFDSGELTHVIPNTLGSHKSSCDAVWADCITMIPYKLYEMYGDISFLSDNYEAMKKYIGSFELYKEDGLVKKGHQYGDWLSLDTEHFFGDNEAHGGTDKYLLANVFYSVSVNIVSKAAKILGFKSDYKKYCDLYKKIVKDIRREYFTPNGRILSETVTAQTVALTFNIVPEKYRTNMAAALAENVKKHGYHVTTGFIGTAYLLYALSDNGYFDVAEKVLMNEEYPGWLYEVKSGATTIWERWNSLMPDGTPNPQGMTSFNHYAYGSVMEFVYRRVAGIDAVEPGFKKVRISPHPVDGIDSLTASYQSVNGEIISGYKIENDKITYSVEIPEKIYGEVYLPECEGPVFIGSGKFSKEIYI